ncbi:hypothetical protein OVA14_07290 [Agrococcus sp. SL85]|uniref:hypothetical protein n=1 Tax=Agrococcus sp. SL85 TaxID=2995141 RepID=UPI00226C7BBA|nr:hypothetical protein [Agrococcus sp. SL85]WAC65197.1 hypothetical protein OVA14_07290 [Agrococcus sp. SL85]
MTIPATTQQAHPWRAAWRTAVEVGAVLSAAAIAAGPLLSDFVAHFWPGSAVVPWIAGTIAFLSALAGLLAKLAALPQVDRLLELLRLGSAPGVGRHAKER